MSRTLLHEKLNQTNLPKICLKGGNEGILVVPVHLKQLPQLLLPEGDGESATIVEGHATPLHHLKGKALLSGAKVWGSCKAGVCFGIGK